MGYPLRPMWWERGGGAVRYSHGLDPEDRWPDLAVNLALAPPLGPRGSIPPECSNPLSTPPGPCSPLQIDGAYVNAEKQAFSISRLLSPDIHAHRKSNRNYFEIKPGDTLEHVFPYAFLKWIFILHLEEYITYYNIEQYRKYCKGEKDRGALLPQYNHRLPP